ncbi:MAG: hypothetical protein RSC49_09650 [Clostridium sp.]
MIKNIISPFIFLIVLYFAFIQSGAIPNGINLYTSVSSFGLMGSTIGILILCTHISGKRYEILTYLSKNKFKRFLSIFLASIYIVTITYVINMLFILFHMNYSVDYIFNIKCILHFTLIWYLSNILAVTIGVFVGTFVGGFGRYILSMIAIAPFFVSIYTHINGSVGLLLINIFDDKLRVAKNNIAGVVFNKFYMLDKLFIFLIIIFLIIIVYIYFRNIKLKNTLVGTVILLMCICCYGTLIYAQRSIDIVNIPSGIEIGDSQSLKSKFSIEEYKMNLDVRGTLKNSCEIKINSGNYNGTDLSLQLDNDFKVDKLEVNNKEVEYARLEGLIVIPLDKLGISNNKSFNIKINYSGDVYKVNSLGGDFMYTGHSSVCLLSDYVNWYPKINTLNSVNYNIEGVSGALLISNLPNKVINKNGSDYKFNIAGVSRSINLVSGNYITNEYNGIKITSSLGGNNEFVGKTTLDIINSMDERVLPKDVVNDIKNKGYNEVILVPCSDVFSLDNNTIFIGLDIF